MNIQDSDAADSTLDADEAALKVNLRSLIDEIHGSQHARATHDTTRIDQVEREIRRVVLQIVQIERDRIELSVANAL